MRVENGDKTFVIKTCMAEERNRYYSETLVIHIVYERKLCNSRKQLEQRLHFENVCKKLVYIVYDLIPSNWLVTVGSKLAIVF